MSVGGVGGPEQPPVVYLVPQAISPLSASKDPIALAMATRPDPAEKSAASSAGAARPSDQVVDRVREVKRAPVVPDPTSAGGSAYPGRVDVYV